MAGRPRKSSVWNYFVHNKTTNTSVCQVLISKPDEEEKKCGKELRGMYASNLKKHLEKQHLDQYKQLQKEETQRKDATTRKQKRDAVTQPNRDLQELFEVTPKYYDKDSKKQLAITKKLAIFVGSTNVPLSLIDRPELRDLLAEMDQQYQVPHRKKLGEEIEKVYNGLKQRIQDILGRTRRCTFCSDIWSKKGMSASFLGITVHCFTHDDKKKHSITLAVRRFESPHTGERIAELFDSILDEWKILPSKIFRALTDNGSNMIKGFNQAASHSSESVEMESEEDNLDEESENEDEELSIAEKEMKEFEKCENDHMVAFSGWKRNSCFTHTLQLVVKEFEKAPCFSSALNKAKKIVKTVNKSCKATEKLVKLAGKKLITNCPTRWDSTFYMLARLNSVKDHLNTVLDELGWDSLTEAQWKQLSTIEELLQPFAHQTNVASSDKTTSIAMVIPILKELDIHLNEMIEKYNIGAAVEAAKNMLLALKSRFEFIFDRNDVDFDGIYMAATLLNPAYKRLLTTSHVIEAKKFIKEMIKVDAPDCSQAESVDLFTQSTDLEGSDESEPPTKRFKHLSRVIDLLEMQEDEESQPSNLSKEDLELDSYIRSKPSKEQMKLDPLLYWIEMANTYPLLSPIACDILTVPASTAQVERTFSVSGEASQGRRNRLIDHNLERETLLRKNSIYL